MHPFWLTFKSSALEHDFTRYNANRKLGTDRSCLLLTSVVELTVLCTVMTKCHGVLGLGFWAHFVCILLPQVFGLACYNCLNTRTLVEWRGYVVLFTKLSYTPLAVFSSTYKNPGTYQTPYARYDTTNPWILAFNDWVGMPIMIAIACETFGNSMAGFGLSLRFRHQFFFQILGCCLSIWEQQSFLPPAMMHFEAGRNWARNVTDGVDRISNIVLYTLDLTGKYSFPIRYPCQSLLAFLQLFFVGWVCLTVVWCCELHEREQFLVMRGYAGGYRKEECINESLVAGAGVQIREVWVDPRVRTLLCLFLLCGAALCWKGWLCLCYYCALWGKDDWLSRNEVW
ncbi:hypothetical protein BSKO_09434 [Bryopsis sp. KO-2023]|nr:hypothetical protein BSKO_09434 [Bryopsis sp. KO-2023]